MQAFSTDNGNKNMSCFMPELLPVFKQIVVLPGWGKMVRHEAAQFQRFCRMLK